MGPVDPSRLGMQTFVASNKTTNIPQSRSAPRGIGETYRARRDRQLLDVLLSEAELRAQRIHI